MSDMVLVTGAYGFVGRHVSRALANNGAYVIGIGHGNWGRDEWIKWGICEWHTGDITIENLITYAGEPNFLFHCAGSGSVAFSMAHPMQDWQRTVDSTLSILEYIRTQRPNARLVIPSSAGVYGVAEKMPIRINDNLLPVSPYGFHKKVAEELCRSYAMRFGIRAAIVRLFSVYGIGIRKQLLWDACTKISQGNFEFFGTGFETRDWLHIEDAVQLMLCAAEHASISCPVVNGGEGVAVSIRDVLDLVSTKLGNKNKIYFNGIQRVGDPIHYQADISEALNWDWKPIKSRVHEMASYVDWFVNGAE